MFTIKTATLAAAMLFSTSSFAAEAIRGFERVTTCEARAEVGSGWQVVDSVRILKGGLTAANGSTQCENLALRKAQRLCKLNSKSGLAPTYRITFGFKIAQFDFNPPFPVCEGPTDPRCLDPILQSFKLETIAAKFQEGTCTELLSKSLPDETASSTVVEGDIEQ